MPFNSLLFLAFFAAVLIVHWSPLPWTGRKIALVLASYLFYGSWSVDFIPLLVISTLVGHHLGERIDRTEHVGQRKLWCVLAVVAALITLATFKYRAFLLDEIVAPLAGSLGIPVPPAHAPGEFPLGISFYVFESIAYVVDVYRRRIRAAASLLDYTIFISFFPHLICGPIVRPGDFLPQLAGKPSFSSSRFAWGMTLVTIGLFLKIVVADQMGVVADRVFVNQQRSSAEDAWIGTLAFSLQIYADFAGYSTCAIGLALCLGLVLNENFNAPYAANGFSDFWRRWHMSLSRWLRDYLYIPLGGNRHGMAVTVVALMVTMLLGGLWHGAAWHFVAWGGIHGIFLAMERAVRREHSAGSPPPMRPWWIRLPQILGVFSCISVTWIFFRARDLTHAWGLVLDLFGQSSADGVLAPSAVLMVTVFTVLTLTAHWRLRDESLVAQWQRMPWWLRAILISAMLTLIALTPEEDRAFIYFNF